MSKKKNQARFAMISRRAVMDDDLSSTDFKVLAIIGLYLNAEFECWPMQETIANVPRKPMSKSTVSRSIKRLKDGGYIIARKKWPNRPGTHLCYQVLLDGDVSEMVKNDIPEDVKTDALGIAPKECNSGIAPKDATPIRTNPDEGSFFQKDLTAAFDAYQAIARKVGFPLVRVFSDARKKKLGKILETHGLKAWGDVLRKAGNSSHCKGHNDRGWRASFDFLVTPASFIKTLEGNYDDKPNPNSRPGRAAHSRRGSSDRLSAFDGPEDELDATEPEFGDRGVSEFRDGSGTIEGEFSRVEPNVIERIGGANQATLQAPAGS